MKNFLSSLELETQQIPPGIALICKDCQKEGLPCVQFLKNSENATRNLDSGWTSPCPYPLNSPPLNAEVCLITHKCPDHGGKSIAEHFGTLAHLEEIVSEVSVMGS